VLKAFPDHGEVILEAAEQRISVDLFRTLSSREKFFHQFPPKLLEKIRNSFSVKHYVKGDMISLFAEYSSVAKNSPTASPRFGLKSPTPVPSNSLNIQFLFVGLGRLKTISEISSQKSFSVDEGSFFGEDYFISGISSFLLPEVPPEKPKMPLLKVISDRATVLVIDAKTFCDLLDKKFKKEKSNLIKKLKFKPTEPTLIRTLSISRHPDAGGLQKRVSDFLTKNITPNSKRNEKININNPSKNKPGTTSAIPKVDLVAQMEEILASISTDLDHDQSEKIHKIATKIQRLIVKSTVERAKI